MAGQLRRAGMEVDKERAAPEWFGKGPPGAPERAIMDIVCRSPGTNTLHCLDVAAICNRRRCSRQGVHDGVAEEESRLP